ncbi:MAG: outer membrane lipoprotein carrier protein LolA [Thermoanaerobaculia bacterium]
MHRTALRVRLATAACLLCAALAAAAGADDDPWRLLDAARDRLAERPQVADFVQTYVPAGFSSGESEAGTVAFDLPERARWDYADPYPRSFLVSGSTVFAWSEGDDAGRRLDLASEEARHLDLLRLDTATLSQRYVAELAASGPDGGREVLLTPVDPQSEIVEARLLIGEDLRLTELSYRDGEGNLTRFELSTLRPLPDASVLVAPELEWREP